MPVPAVRRMFAEARDKSGKRNAGDELHTQKTIILLGIHDLGEDLDDVLMLEPGERSGLAPLIRGYFQSHEPVQRNLPGQINTGETARTQQAKDLVIFNNLSLRQRGQGPGHSSC